MTLLDRFRTQPREKHPDPAVRLAYVEEIPLDDRGQIAAIAREDEDARVRKAAVAKLMDPAVLGRIARDDADEGVRGQATAMLRDIALEAFEGVGESDSLDAVDAIDDAKLLAQVAKGAAREVVAVKALAALAGRAGAADLHMLGSIARHGAAEAARRGAFDLLRERNEQAEILAVAMNGEYKDTALAAAEIVTGRAELEQIAARGKNKAAAKRARAVLREADEQVAREAGEAAQAAAALTIEIPAAVPSTFDARPAAEAAPAAVDPTRTRARGGRCRGTRPRRGRRTRPRRARGRERREGPRTGGGGRARWRGTTADRLKRARLTSARGAKRWPACSICSRESSRSPRRRRPRSKPPIGRCATCARRSRMCRRCPPSRTSTRSAAG